MNTLSERSQAMITLHDNIRIIDDLLGGTATMRSAGQRYLFKMELESEQGYKNRLNRSTLYPALSETLSQMTGRVFFKPISVSDVHYTLTEKILPDVDLEGNNLDIFAAKLFYAALAHGAAYVLTDYTRTDNVRTKAEENALGARPYLVLIKAHQVLGLKTAVINGKRQLTQFRYREWLTVPNGEFGEKQIEQIVVYEMGRVRKFRQIDGQFVETERIELKAQNQPLGFVPITAFITKNASTFLLGEPPLLELAHLNVKHWQSQSDQDNILNTARVPIMVRTGVYDDAAMQIGGSLIDLPENGSLSYVEHSGNAIAAGAESLKELESQMRTAGAKLLDKTTMAMTVEQARDEQSKEISQLRLYANKLEDSLDLVLEHLGHWLGIAPDECGKVEISGNIEANYDPNSSMETLLKMQSVGVLSRHSAFEEAKRRGLLSDNLDWEDEQARLQAEGIGEDFAGSFNSDQSENTA